MKKMMTKKVLAMFVGAAALLALPLFAAAQTDKLVVQDGGGADVFTVDDAGLVTAGQVNTSRLGAGTTNPLSSFHLFDQGAAFDRGLTIHQANDSNAASVVSIKRSRGTEAAPLSIQSGDNIVGFHGQVYDGTSWIVPASFMYVSDGPVSTGSAPAAMIFKTGTINPTPERMRISSDGAVTVSDLAGSGNAYVCVDASGKIFRSATTCN